jgi:hypothetical protein
MVPPPQQSTRYYSKEKAYKVGMGVKMLRVMVIFTPTLALPHQGGGNLFFSSGG